METKLTEENKISGFAELDLPKNIAKAIDTMGFDSPTEIQSKAIPLIRQGKDVIGRSQTGTGKTMAFAIPAIEKIESSHHKHNVQILIMLPTRELAIQCSDEIKKLTKYTDGIRPVEVYGGAPMDRQIVRLKRANIVIGTPGRIMDHMRRKTLKLDHIKLVVLDEADEMLSMGFKEDMETILRETPETRQTVLFSATMPPSIMAITNEFQKNPCVVQVNKKQVTLDNIIQNYVDVPMGRKTDALKLLIHYFSPSLSMVFCNTKKTVDEVTEALNKGGFNTDALHGDLKQSQRTAVMDKFRCGSTNILVATDVAARGIDVNDVEYVFNYDVPQNNEYYVHRIGRTGRIGKKGSTVTICSGRRQVMTLLNIAHNTKSKITEIAVPTSGDINQKLSKDNIGKVEEKLSETIEERYTDMVNMLLEKGYSLFDIAAAALKMNFADKEIAISDIKKERKQYGKNGDQNFSKIILNIGRSSHAAPNHIVASITERSILHGSDIGKIEIYDDSTVVAVPSETVNEVIDSMYGAKVCGKPVKTMLFGSEKNNRPKNRKTNLKDNRKILHNKKKFDGKKSYGNKSHRRSSKRQG